MLDWVSTVSSAEDLASQEGDRFEECTQPENYPLLHTAHFHTEIVKCIFSEVHGIILLSFSNGEADSFIVKVENEGNIDYDDQTEKL